MKQHELVVNAKCVICGHKRQISEGEVPKGEQPMCDKCFSPMVAESVEPKK